MAVFTLQDANQIPYERRVPAETSLLWLREVSDMIKHHEWPSYDMTGTLHADWRAYLAHHWSRDHIIGPGVLSFEVHLLDRISFGPRYGFVVRRVDGTDACILPVYDNESIRVGRLEEWLPDHTPPARLLYYFEPAAMLADPLPNLSSRDVTDFLDIAVRSWRASV